MSQHVTFKELLNQRTWHDYETYIEEGIHHYIETLSDEIAHGKAMKQKVRDFVEAHFDIKRLPHELLEEEELLTSGQVIGVDGTVAIHKTISGAMAQIGVVAVNYQNERIQHSCFVSEAQYNEEIKDVAEYLNAHESKNRILSNLVIRAILFYREREIGLNDKFINHYKIYHGRLLPFELMTGLGKLRALETTLKILEAIIRNKRCFSIISRSQNDAFMRIGMALNSGEYFLLKHTNVGMELLRNEDFMAKDKWREEELLRMTHFLKQEASKILIGIIKISQRPYVFHAHQDYFEEAARIIARDAMFQREKGFPLLIDYADNLCSTLFKATDFNNIVEFKLAQEGEFLSEMPEDSLRQK